MYLTDDVKAALGTLLIAYAFLIFPAPVRSDAVKPPLLHDTRARDTLSSAHSDHFPPAGNMVPDKPETRRAYVTGYNTVPEQTDATPCEAMGGHICGRRDTAACPRDIPLHSWVMIAGKKYECMDRTAVKHDGRFDISCDKDRACPALLTGWRIITLIS